jgi:tripartite-type tricarboxylate transporter receptor subunit TctC
MHEASTVVPNAPSRPGVSPEALRGATIAAVLWFTIGAASAQAWPSRPVRLVVGTTTGAPDTVARILATQLTTQTGQAFVVDNRPGANTNIASEFVARAPPDGYTLLVTPATFAVNPSTHKKLPFDVRRDFTPVTNIGSGEAYILVSNPALPARSVNELVELARRPDSRFAFGSPGIGSPIQLAGAMFAARTGADLVHIAYKGTGPAMTAMLAGEIQILFISPPTAMPMISAGKLRAIAYTGSTRASFLPDTPTMAEAGVKGMELDAMSWYGVFGPARLPGPTTAGIQQAFRAGVMDPTTHERLRGLNLEPDGSTPAAFAKFFDAQLARFAEMVKQAGFRPE